MVIDRPAESLVRILSELCALSAETEWVEFKRNNTSPELIGEYISALANSAALKGKSQAWLVWGVDDETHEIVGTTFKPSETKVGNEELESWLLRLLTPKVVFRFHEVDVKGAHIVMLEVSRDLEHPVRFKNEAFVRIGSYKKNLKGFPRHERDLWRVLDQKPFESRISVASLDQQRVVQLLDDVGYFAVTGQQYGQNGRAIEYLLAEKLIESDVEGTYSISNLGALLLARDLGQFRSLGRKAIRIVLYRDTSRYETVREEIISKGYAIGFEEAVRLVMQMIPSKEEIGQVYRETTTALPELAVRELIANALIHQDFTMGGAGPLIEVFSNRVEITNPGAPFYEPDRLLDQPPHSRNEALASFMRRIGICEERGTGIDKVVMATEQSHLPAPLFQVVAQQTRAVLFMAQTEMTKQDRIRACYLHACLKYVEYSFMTNTSIRERFDIKKANSSQASRYIKEALDAGVIAVFDQEAGNRNRKYVPFWAVQ